MGTGNHGVREGEACGGDVSAVGCEDWICRRTVRHASPYLDLGWGRGCLLCLWNITDRGWADCVWKQTSAGMDSPAHHWQRMGRLCLKTNLCRDGLACTQHFWPHSTPVPCLSAPGPITAELRAIFMVTVYRLISRFRVVLGLSGAKLSRKYLWSPAFRSLESVVHLSHQKCKFHGQRSLAGCSPWGCKESDTTERLTRSVVHSPAGWALPGNVSGMWSQAPPQNFQNGRLYLNKFRSIGNVCG